MASFESNNELDLGAGKRLRLRGLNFVKTRQPLSWVKWLYEIDFSSFITSISNVLSFNNTTNTLTSNINGVSSTVILPTWNTIRDLAVIEEQTNNTINFVNINALGQNLVVGAVYEIEVVVVWNTQATTTGIKLSFGGAVAPSIYTCHISIPTATTTTSFLHYASPNTETPTAAASRINNNYATMKLIFGCASTGIYYPRFGSEVNASTVTIKRGTNIKIRRLS